MRHVLIVENDALCRADIAETLEENGFRVEGVGSGGEALERLENGAEIPDAILLDLVTPGLNGWQFRRLQAAHPRFRDIPVVLMSGSPDLDREVRALAAAGRLKKPFELSALLEVLAKLTR